MRLAAVYIPQNSLPHIFGENHEGKTLNLGGEYFYSFIENTNEIKIGSKIKNELFIPNFYNTHISLISSIVGQNGVGKSTLLRALNHSIDPSSKKVVYVFEIEEKENIQIYNDTSKAFLGSDDFELEIVDRKLFEPLYYSPALDYDLKDLFSPIALINHLDEDLEKYYLDSISRNVSFLNDKIIDSIKNVYEDFPNYDLIKVKAKKHRKSNFRAPYLEANFGNPHRGDALKNELSGEVMRLENDDNYGKETYTKKELIELNKRNIRFLEEESFTEQFNKLWEVTDYKFSDDSGYDYIHGSNSFIKNTEINILSYLLLGAVFHQTGLGGGINFSRISTTGNFKERLDLFLEMYLVNEEKIISKKIKSEIGFDIDKNEEITNIIRNYPFSQVSGIDLNEVKNRMILYIDGITEIHRFYNKLVDFCKNDFIKFQQDSIIYNIKNDETKLLFDELIFAYRHVLKSFPKTPISISLFDFFPNKKLSTGEKAILDFYASIYNYIDVNKESKYKCHEYYLLLLDEPDLGFHPLWKKKFINAISTTLPILFSRIKPQVYDGKNYVKVRENPVIQIIFTTHDPLTLSDIPNNSVVYLKKESEFSKILNTDDVDRPQKTFGGNIHELLAHSFFIEDGLIGEFAKDKIGITLNWLKIKANESNLLLKGEKYIYDIDNNIDIIEFANKEDEFNYHRQIIELIDEPLVKNKLKQMFIEFANDNSQFLNYELEKAEQKVQELKERIKGL